MKDDAVELIISSRNTILSVIGVVKSIATILYSGGHVDKLIFVVIVCSAVIATGIFYYKSRRSIDALTYLYNMFLDGLFLSGDTFVGLMLFFNSYTAELDNISKKYLADCFYFTRVVELAMNISNLLTLHRIIVAKLNNDQTNNKGSDPDLKQNIRRPRKNQTYSLIPKFNALKEIINKTITDLQNQKSTVPTLTRFIEDYNPPDGIPIKWADLVKIIQSYLQKTPELSPQLMQRPKKQPSDQ